LLTLPPAIASLHYLQLSRDRQSDCLEQVTDPAPQPILDAVQVQQLLQFVQSIAPQSHLSDVDFEWLLTEEQFWLTQVRSVPAPIDAVLVRGLAASAGRSIGTACVLAGDKLPDDLPDDAIVVASKIAIESPHFSRIRGFAIEQGGLTSHSAIIARELGIPAIVGATNATQRVQTGDRVCLDGDRGLLYRVDSGEPLAEKYAAPPAIALPALKTRLMVNLSQLVSLEAVRGLPIAGVGLLRSEMLLLDLLQMPANPETIAQIADRIRPVVEAMYPRPVYYRSIDRAITEGESNPLLGLHGTFSYQLEGDWFERELLALHQLQQSGYDNLHLLLPFVRTVEEFRFCRSRIQKASLMQANFQLWIMAEVPSVLFLLPEYVKAGAQGIAIGTNDLTQLLLGIDRDQPQFARYSAKHPAVLQAIRQLIQTAQQLGISCSSCGQAPSQFPELVALLVQWGITAISVEPPAIEPTARAIAQAAAIQPMI
ncbi:MAG: phosphoenolpyruvate synthase, partial [Microcoleus sp. SIO2G3]|nr:phosphoenolpyruvate synthase [Microcoleus sp. SIO2G3]